MSRVAMVIRLSVAVLLAGCGLIFLLLARDTWHWARAMRDADARTSVQLIGPDAWTADTILPGSWVRSLLGIDDDLAFRRAVLDAIRLIQHHGFGNERVLVETELARIVLSDPSKVRASEAADYLGVLLYDDHAAPQQAISPYNPKQPAASPQTPAQKALAEFETAVRLDPNNANAKKNLELLLDQQGRPQSQKGTPNPGTGDKVGTKGSGQQSPGYGY